MPKSTRTVPRPLARATERFEKWRKRGRARRKIPDRLWDLARSLGETYGVNRTARALRLDYYDLKGRVEATGPSRAPTPRRPRPSLKCFRSPEASVSWRSRTAAGRR